MNLLTEPVFRIRTSQGLQTLSLPALLAALGGDEVASLPGLQRHQEDPFHIFLCYLAATVLDRQGVVDPRQSEDFWLDGIRKLTGRDDDAAWTLVVEDVTKPAFMQPAMSATTDVKQLKPNASTPDELDILPTAKNHDIKTARALKPQADEWSYALISLQTMAGYFGRGNFGVARMNGGFASRPCVELQKDRTSSGRWQRGVSRLLALRPELLETPWPYQDDGEVLLWRLPWNGISSFSLNELDPFFIEIARIVRLVEKENRLVAMAKPSRAARIQAKDQLGVMGDPWIPLNAGKKKLTALTVSATGLTPDLLQKLIFEDGLTPAAMQKPALDEIGKPVWFYASVLVRGQGTTDGFHSIHLPIPTKVGFALFGGGRQRDRLGRLSKEGLNDAKTVQNKALKVALFSLLEAGPDKVNFDKREVSAWVDQSAHNFSEAWSRDYFDWLWRTLDYEDEEQARIEWLNALKEKALVVLEDAIARLPERQGRRYRARVKASGLFFGSLDKQFPELKEQRDAKQSA
ncbi:MAG: type I-E CRISPR-associated protein Cse1/CasA [Candidatus Thiodiazotropha sp. (ex Epidulcina cf. delphinae)]|nr:type I-E CRISPR-associated protein Cse1/CasA [Candidatus Thiodiazotropha sp. (ex Epidulcina cf. delphinae)]